MPNVSPAQQAQDILNKLLESPRRDWDHLLPTLCPPDTDVRQHVERLIKEFDGTPDELPDVPASNFGVLDSESAAIASGGTQNKEAISSGLPNFDEGRQLGRFRIQSELGRGGFGVVYAAEEHLADGKSRFVALKFVKEQEEIAREIQTQSHFHHANIVEVYGSATVGPWHFIVMELVSDGEQSAGLPQPRFSSRTLTHEVSGTGMSYRRAAELAMQISDAVAAAHSVRIVHLDIKPANVLITKLNNAKVSDFSLAAQIRLGQNRFLQPGGTIGFAAPEQLCSQVESGSLIDTRSDIFSIGATLFYMLTGQPIFRADHKENRIEAYLDFFRLDPEKRLSPDDVRSGVPQDLANICSKCLRIDPKARYQTAHEVVADLYRFLKHEPIAGTSGLRTVLLTIRRNPVAVAVIVVLMGLALFLLLRVLDERDRFFAERERFRGSSRAAFGLTQDVLDEMLDESGNHDLRRNLRGRIAARVPALDRLLSETPEEITTIRALAKAHMLLGMEHFEGDQFEEAVSEYDESLRLFDQIFKDRSDSALRWIDRAGVHESRALVLLAMGKADDARKDYELALPAYREAEARMPELKGMAQTVEGLLQYYPRFVADNVNGFMVLGRYEAAATVANEAIRLIGAEEQFTNYERTESIRILTDVRDAALKVPHALENPESVLDEPVDQQVTILTSVSRETSRDGSSFKARADLAIRAISTLEKAVELHPPLALGPVCEYNLACAYARAFSGVRDVDPATALSFHDKALRYLKQPLKDPGIAQSCLTDEDLASIRETVGFQKRIGQ